MQGNKWRSVGVIRSTLQYSDEWDGWFIQCLSGCRGTDAPRSLWQNHSSGKPIDTARQSFTL